MRPAYFLRVGDDAPDEVTAYRTKTAAIEAYAEIAKELWRYGQKIGASIHIAATKDEVDEYPDFVLSLGPRGGVVAERA